MRGDVGSVLVGASNLLTIEAGAGAPGTLTWILVVFLIAAVTAVPALGLRFVLDQRGRLRGGATNPVQ